MKNFFVALCFLFCLTNVGRAAPVALTATPLWGTEISAGEPVLVRVTLKNPTNKAMGIGVSDDSFPDSIYLAVFDEAGKLLSSPPPTGQGGGLSSSYTIPAGGSESKTYSVTAWHRFDRSGRFSIRVQLLGVRSQTEFKAPLAVLAQHTVQITVTPKSEARLKEKCEELYKWAYLYHRGNPFTFNEETKTAIDPPMSSEVAMRALLSVRDEVALPFFVRLAKADYYGTNACLALRQLQTQQATKIVEELAKRQDNIGKGARQALRQPLAEMPITYRERFIAD